MFRFLLVLLCALTLSPAFADDELVAVPEDTVATTTTTGTHWICRYSYGAESSYIECMNGEYDEALSDTPPTVKRLQVFSLPMSVTDIEFAEQLIDAVLCYNVPDCTSELSHPLRG